MKDINKHVNPCVTKLHIENLALQQLTWHPWAEQVKTSP
jgi:hypothetical protein